MRRLAQADAIADEGDRFHETIVSSHARCSASADMIRTKETRVQLAHPSVRLLSGAV